MNPINLLLVDDHTILRQGLKQLLELDPSLHVSAEAENGEEAIVQALSKKPDVILMDINLPKLSGYEATQAILTAWPQARIIVLTNQDDAHILKKFIDLGVHAFLLKDVQADDLALAIHRVHQGELVALAPELKNKLAHLSDASSQNRHEHLTEREKEVLLALAKGYSNQQLADLLCVSPKTINNHLYNIYGKIHAHNRAEAILWTLAHLHTR